METLYTWQGDAEPFVSTAWHLVNLGYYVYFNWESWPPNSPTVVKLVVTDLTETDRWEGEADEYSTFLGPGLAAETYLYIDILWSDGDEVGYVVQIAPATMTEIDRWESNADEAVESLDIRFGEIYVINFQEELAIIQLDTSDMTEIARIEDSGYEIEVDNTYLYFDSVDSGDVIKVAMSTMTETDRYERGTCYYGTTKSAGYFYTIAEEDPMKILKILTSNMSLAGTFTFEGAEGPEVIYYEGGYLYATGWDEEWNMVVFQIDPSDMTESARWNCPIAGAYGWLLVYDGTNLFVEYFDSDNQNSYIAAIDPGTMNELETWEGEGIYIGLLKYFSPYLYAAGYEIADNKKPLLIQIEVPVAEEEVAASSAAARALSSRII